METVDCTLCGADSALPFLRLKDLSFGLTGEFQLVRCRQCDLIYVNPRPSPDKLADYYPSHYRPFRGAIEDEQWALMRWMRRRNIRRRRQAAETFAARQEGRVLDVGCSTGIFLAEMRDSGWRVTGVELTEPAARYARERFGIEVIEGSLEEAALPAEAFDVITFWDVLEHTYDPLGTLRLAHHLLRKGGIVVATVPNYHSLDRRLFGPAWIGFDVPRHLSVFTPNTLRLMLSEAGLDVVDLRCEFGGFFTFAASFHRWANVHVPWTTMRTILRRVIDLPGLRLPFEPLFGLIDRLAGGSELVVVACKGQ